MKPIRTWTRAFAIASALSASAAYAEEGSRALLTFELSGLRWYKNSSLTSFQTPSTESNGRSTFTGDLSNSLIKAQIAAFSLYFHVFQDSNTMLAFSYHLNEEWELGIDLGINSSRRDNPTNEVDTQLFGAFGRFIQTFQGWQLDHTLVFDVTQFEQTYADAYGNKRSTEGRGSYAQLESRYFLSLAANAWYFAGISYSMLRDKVSGASGELRSSQLGLTLAGLRVTLD